MADSGMLKDWTSDEHHADRTCVSFSMMKHLGKVDETGEFINPKVFKHHWDNHDPKSTKALEFGKLAHIAVYEPDRLIAEVVARPVKDDGKLHGTNTNIFKEFAAMHDGKTLVAPVDLAVVTGILAACRASPALQKLHTLTALYREQSIVWKDEETGLNFKIRPDQLLEGRDGWIIEDLKTTVDATPYQFRRSCFKYEYYRRAAFYADGVEALTGMPARTVLIAVTKERPFQVGVYEPAEAQLEDARRQNLEVKLELAKRFDADDWSAPWETEPMIL